MYKRQLSDRFIEIGNIKLNKGRMPAKDNEIAVEWSTLIKLEQGSDIGQDIVIDTYLNGTSDKLTKTYKLVGILNSYTDVWQGGDKLPGIIVTESEGKSINRYGGGIFIYPCLLYTSIYVLRRRHGDIFLRNIRKCSRGFFYVQFWG